MFEWMDKESAAIVLWGVTILVVGWTWLPAIIAASGGTRYRMRGVEKTDQFPANTPEADYEVWANQLRELGYEGFAVGETRIDNLEADWRVQAPFRVFYSRQKYAYAVVQKMHDPWSIWREVVFVTRLTDGGLVLTRNVPTAPAAPAEPGAPPVLRQGIESYDLAEVERLHLDTLEVLKRSGQRPDSDHSLENLLASLESVHGPEVQRISQVMGKKYLALHFIIHGCVSLPAGYYAGLAHWGLPLTNLILCVIMRIGEVAQKRMVATIMREAMRQRTAPKPEEPRVWPGQR